MLGETNRISEHISYKEGIRSSTAKRLNIDNDPDDSQLSNMETIAKNIFLKVVKYPL